MFFRRAILTPFFLLLRADLPVLGRQKYPNNLISNMNRQSLSTTLFFEPFVFSPTLTFMRLKYTRSTFVFCVHRRNEIGVSYLDHTIMRVLHDLTFNSIKSYDFSTIFFKTTLFSKRLSAPTEPFNLSRHHD